MLCYMKGEYYVAVCFQNFGFQILTINSITSEQNKSRVSSSYEIITKRNLSSMQFMYNVIDKPASKFQQEIMDN
jgi:hypothetical protein